MKLISLSFSVLLAEYFNSRKFLGKESRPLNLPAAFTLPKIPADRLFSYPKDNFYPQKINDVTKV